jgi:basic membrane lipoprotein Med (substrate-binding protein (PBP1-ABC) superfamily)/DNA-binding SARP family transcriptional activator
LHRNEAVSVDRIVDELWAEEAPKTAGQAVRVYVSQLRKALEPHRSDAAPQVLVTQGNGYLLRVEPQDVDVDRFDTLRSEGRRLLAVGEAVQAASELAEALSLWRGPSLQDFAYETFAQPEISRLEELRLATYEDQFDAELAAGRDSELVADLEQLVEANPLRERLRGQLMLALYRSGRQADALETYRRGRRLLVDELGLEPGVPLRRLEAQILQQDPELETPAAAPAPRTPAGPPRRVRRTSVAAIALTVLVGVAAIAAVVAATTGNGGRPSAASLRVALVLDGTRRESDTLPAGLDPLLGLHAAAKSLGVRTKAFYGGDGVRRTFIRAVAKAAQRSDFVIVDSTPNLWALSKVTRRFPGTRFFVPDSVRDPHADFHGQLNVTGVNFDDRENGYLGGYLAALMTHGRQAVSAVAGIPTHSVRGLLVGFEDGAQRARPGIRVLVGYSGSFSNESPCEALANRQIDRGSAVIFNVAGGCGLGALQAAGVRRAWGIGVDSDQSDVGPQVIASVVKRKDLVTEFAIRLFARGLLPRGRDIPINLVSGFIGLEGITESVPPSVSAKVEAVAAKLRARDQARDSRDRGLAATTRR